MKTSIFFIVFSFFTTFIHASDNSMCPYSDYKKKSHKNRHNMKYCVNTIPHSKDHRHRFFSEDLVRKGQNIDISIFQSMIGLLTPQDEGKSLIFKFLKKSGDDYFVKNLNKKYHFKEGFTYSVLLNVLADNLFNDEDTMTTEDGMDFFRADSSIKTFQSHTQGLGDFLTNLSHSNTPVIFTSSFQHLGSMEKAQTLYLKSKGYSEEDNVSSFLLPMPENKKCGFPETHYVFFAIKKSKVVSSRAEDHEVKKAQSFQDKPSGE